MDEAYAAGPWVAAGLSAAGGFVLALAGQAGLWVPALLTPLPHPVEHRAGAVS